MIIYIAHIVFHTVILSFFASLPVASLILSNSQEEKANLSLICDEFNIKFDQKKHLLNYANGLLCGHKDRMGCLYIV